MVGQMTEAEATYSASAQPPNQPTTDDNRYISVRITLSHAQVYKIEERLVYDVESYIIAPHKANSDNEHFHVAIPIGNEKSSTACERYRKRAKAINGGGAGKIAVKLYENGIEQFVAYVKHEDCQPVLKNYEKSWWDEIERKSKEQTTMPRFLEKESRKRPRNPDHFNQITFQNLERVTLRFRRENGITSTELEDTLEAMHKEGWRLQISVHKQGIPEVFYEQFTKACKNETVFTAGRFARMRVLEKWREDMNMR